MLVLLLIGLCLLPEPPLEHPDNPMAMEGLGYGAGLALLFIWGISFDFIFSLPSLLFMPFLLSKVFAVPNASLRRRKFYCMVGGLQVVMLALGGFVLLQDEPFDLATLWGGCLAGGLYLIVGLTSARKLYAYWLADEYYWPEERP
jgi:hypothetical protein